MKVTVASTGGGGYCDTCMWAKFIGAEGWCLRPFVGLQRRKLSDPFLPRVTAADFCGSQTTLYAVKNAKPWQRGVKVAAQKPAHAFP